MKQIFLKIFAGLLFLAGLAFFLYPVYGKLMNRYENANEIKDFKKDITISTEQEELPEGYWKLYEDCVAYNQKIYEEGQVELTDPFDYQNTSFQLSDYGIESEMIGTLWIPRMEVELPVYLGANTENMSKGAGVLGQTSMPVGGENTNTVLAAHRGWKGIPMFRDIQKMQIGDKIQITTPWDTLVYRVCELKIVMAGDVEEILIQPEKELITLLTCHPYTKNTHRYLVFAERTDEEPLGREEDLSEAKATFSEEKRNVTFIDEDGMAWEEQVDGMEYSELQIWLEDYGVFIVLGLVMIIIMLLVMIACKPKKRRRRR